MLQIALYQAVAAEGKNIRGGRIQLLMFSVSHFLAEQQTITVSEISNFLIHCTLNVHFNFTIANLKQ